MCLCVCVRVCERKRECACVYVYMYAWECVWMFVREYFFAIFEIKARHDPAE